MEELRLQEILRLQEKVSLLEKRKEEQEHFREIHEKHIAFLQSHINNLLGL